jgi:hypothetical protein
MKMSKASFGYRLLGMIMLAICGSWPFILGWIEPPLNEEFARFAILLGIGALCLFWIMSIDIDLYRKESENG